MLPCQLCDNFWACSISIFRQALADYLGIGSGLGIRFLVMLGLMAFRALTGASALAAVPIWVAKDAYCNAQSLVRYWSLLSQASTIMCCYTDLLEYCMSDLAQAPAVIQHMPYWTVYAVQQCDISAVIDTDDQSCRLQIWN